MEKVMKKKRAAILEICKQWQGYGDPWWDTTTGDKKLAVVVGVEVCQHWQGSLEERKKKRGWRKEAPWARSIIKLTFFDESQKNS